MTVDERLEFLLKSTESLHETAQETTAQIHELGAKIQELGTKIDLLAESVKGIVFIVQSHQQRLNKLEGQN